MSLRETLTAEALGRDPLSAFSRWLAEASAEAGMTFPNAACLSTVRDGIWPDGRIVLLKGVDPRGFVFFTNYRSVKGRSLVENARAALTFYWDRIGRQVRVRGLVSEVGAQESDAYFRTRPRGSQVGAWASRQSEVIPGREALEERCREIDERYAGREVPRPPHWGGFVLGPEEIEFWQGRDDRLHDRIVYRREHAADSDAQERSWTTERLSP
jgi:pyridoxamine 5'-phosphate oxidase